MNKNPCPAEVLGKTNPSLSWKALCSADAMLGVLLMLAIAIPAFLSNQQSLKPVLYSLFILPTLIAIIAGRLSLPVLFKHSPAVFLLVIPLLYWSLSVLWSDSPDDVYSFLRRTLSLAVFILGVAYVASSNRLNINNYLDIALFIVAVGAIAQLVYIYFYLGKAASWRLGGYSTFGGPIHAAHYFGFFFFYGAVQFIEAKGRLRGAYFFAALACLAYMVMSHSRGPYVAIVCVSLLMFFLKTRSFKWMLVFCALAISLLYFFPEIMTQRGLSYRPEIWLGAVDIIIDNFVVGVGYNESLALEFGDRHIAGHAHNLYLDIFSRSGVIGFSFVMLMVIFVCRRAVVCNKAEMPFIAALLFFFVGMLTDVQRLLNSPTEVYIMFWLPLTILITLQTSAKTHSSAA